MVHYFAIYVYEWIIFDTFIQIDCVHLSVQRELFIKVVSSHSIRMFLEWFTLTQMFDVFITDRLKDDFMPGQVDYFVNTCHACLLTYLHRKSLCKLCFIGLLLKYHEFPMPAQLKHVTFRAVCSRLAATTIHTFVVLFLIGCC